MRFRQINNGDQAALADLFERMSPESRRRRYFSPKPSLTARELDRLTDVDHATHEAIAALDDSGRIIGVARYVETAEPASAEIAVEVADDHQGTGVARALVTTIMLSASGRGYTRLVATVLWENCPARSLFKSLGFRAFRSSGGIVELQANGLAAMKKMATSTSTPSVTSAAM
jgi:RimJ/RimL family protein N-acetyltransferase